MSKVDDLISELCPEGVPARPISSVLQRKKGIQVTASQMKTLDTGDGQVRVFAGGQTFADVDSLSLAGQHSIEGPGIVVKSRGIIEFVFWEGRFTHKNELWSYIPKSESLDLKFAYYLLASKVEWFISLAKSKSVKMPQLKVADTEDYEIPVPPLAVQREIVEILDKFTQLEAELEAELEGRREALPELRRLSFEGFEGAASSRLVELGEVTEKVSKIDWTQTSEEKKYIDLASVDRSTSTIADTGLIDSLTAPSRAQQLVNENDVILGTTRPLLRRVALVPSSMDLQVASTGFCVLRPLLGLISPDFLFHLISSNRFFEFVSSQQQGASYPSIADSAVKSYKFWLPSLDDQKRVSSSLSAMVSLTNSISDGLPAEIAARRKQYAHYRDKLLTFKDLDSA